MDSLTMADSGDCCPAQARVLVGKGSQRLMFCYHHYRLHMDKLLFDGWKVIVDDMAGLLVKIGADVH